MQKEGPVEATDRVAPDDLGRGRRAEDGVASWRAQAERIRELDRLLAQPEFVVTIEPSESTTADAIEAGDRRLQSDRGRSENVRRLHELRRQMQNDLLGTLAWVRELVTMIHLAKFSGAPASRAEELVSQIAAAVEGLREASRWHEAERTSDLVAAD